MPVLKKGKKATATRIVLYGVEGIGKSTLASQMPDPVWIDVEGSTRQMDVARLEYDRQNPEPQTFKEILECLDDVINGNIECRTIVLDTADAAEQLMRDEILQSKGVEALADIPFGKGTSMMGTLWETEVIGRLDKLVAKGINVCMIVHAKQGTFTDPSGSSYTQWQLSLTKYTDLTTKQWADLILFCNYKTMVVEDNGKNKQKGKPKRMMYCTKSAGFDAKNRYGLDDEYELGIKPLIPIFEGQIKKKETAPILDVTSPSNGIVDADNPIEETPQALIKRKLKEHGLSEEVFNAFMEVQGQPCIDEDSEVHLKKMLDKNFDRLVGMIKEWTEKNGTN